MKKIIVHEYPFKDILADEYCCSSDKIEVIYHGVEDLQTISKPEACEKLDLSPNQHIVLFMGYLTGYKGLDLLIEGFSEYTKKDSSAFLIIGAGKHPKLIQDTDYEKEYTRLMQKADNLIPTKQFSWIGFIEEEQFINYFSAADVSVYPYTVQISSSGPMAISLAYEKPFLASDAFAQALDADFLFKKTSQDLSLSLERFFENPTRLTAEVKKMKQERLFSRIGARTYHFYETL